MKVNCEMLNGKVKTLSFEVENQTDHENIRALINRAANCWELRPKWLETLVDNLAVPYWKS